MSITMDHYEIETMKPEHVATAVDWAAEEGWNPGLHDAETFFTADSHGFFRGVLDGATVATGSAIVYDDTFAFCGLYIVAPDQRGNGYGLALTKARLDYCGDRNVGIDGVLENVEIYKRVGYAPFHENYRFKKRASKPRLDELQVRPYEARDFPALKAYDRQCFPAARDQFLRAWLEQANAKALVYEQDGEVKGYAVRRACREGHKVGPLFADDPAIADALFSALQADVEGDSIYLDVPGNNPAAIRLAQRNRMDKIFATMRMYRKGLPDIEHEKIFGITTFELG